MNGSSPISLSHHVGSKPARPRDFVELAKPRLVLLVLLSAWAGYFLAPSLGLGIAHLLWTLAGTSLVAAGSMVLNEWMEREADSKMKRTAGRPLPTGRVQPAEAVAGGTVLSLSGFLMLYFAVNTGSAVIAFLTFASYLFLYTPLKRKTSLCTIFGALPGALPPLIGWYAASGELAFEAWILFSIVFLWQMPHFLAIAWMYRHDYEAAGFRMLSVEDPNGQLVGRQIILYTFALIPVTLLPTVAGLTGGFYFFVALALGMLLLSLGMIGLRHLDRNAPHLFRASILYLVILFTLMFLDKTGT